MEFVIGAVILLFAVAAIIGWGQGTAQAETIKSNRAVTSTLPEFSAAINYPGDGKSAGVAIDPTRHKFAILRGSQPASVFHFHDLVGVEVFRNENAVTRTNRGSQAVGAAAGALLLGPAGLLLGGLSGSKRDEIKITKLAMKLYTNDLVRPVTEIVFLDFTGTKGLDANSSLLKAPLNDLDEWHGRFKTILAMQDSIPAKPADFSEQSKPKSFLDIDYKVRAID